jgi:hypothetical protein
MLEQLLNSLKSEIGDNISSQTRLPDGHLDKVISVIGNVAKKEVTSQMAGGNLSHLMNLFSDNPNNDGANQIQSDIHSNVISELTRKLGISTELSKNIAGIALPALMSMITKKNNCTPDNDPSPLTELFGAVEGGNPGGIVNDLLGKFLK